MSTRKLVITAVLHGQSQTEVARAYGVSQGWISKLMARYHAEGEAAFELAVGVDRQASGVGGRALVMIQTQVWPNGSSG